mmetsp:Transcript_30426/g.50917  ORF Transcript_30426/g.50917 Transcript_30426/m.50917 type:complete len:178 (-) Transcript_30426:67-600(-)
MNETSKSSGEHSIDGVMNMKGRFLRNLECLSGIDLKEIIFLDLSENYISADSIPTILEILETNEKLSINLSIDNICFGDFTSHERKDEIMSMLHSGRLTIAPTITHRKVEEWIIRAESQIEKTSSQLKETISQVDKTSSQVDKTSKKVEQLLGFVERSTSCRFKAQMQSEPRLGNRQ